MLMIIGKGAGLIAGLAIIMYYVIPRLFASLAKSPELLVLASVAWAFAMAYVSESLGFSKEVGAFLAGVALASTDYREVIGARLVSLRDFLLLFFFVNLGMDLDLGALDRFLHALNAFTRIIGTRQSDKAHAFGAIRKCLERDFPRLLAGIGFGTAD